MTTRGDDCLGHFTLSQFLAGELAAVERDRVALHLDRCDHCKAQLEQIETQRAEFAPLADDVFAAALSAASQSQPEGVSTSCCSRPNGHSIRSH
jgi:anti-sigma factor RsiW